MADLPPGRVLGGRYEIDGVLAHGGTSTIYAARPMLGAGRVIIKRLRDGADEDDVRQFRREFELLRACAHPALPHVLEMFEEEGVPHLVEERVAGHTLREVLERQGPLPWSRVLEVGLALLEVLAWLHRHDVIHRDLKPDNVLLGDDGTVRLIDLGAGRRWRAGADHDTVPLGTPGFAAPEQYGRSQTDARADIYSLAAVLHQALTGIDPAVRPWHFDPPSTFVPGLPDPIDRAVMRALSLDPQARPSSAEQMGRALRGLDVPPVPTFTPRGAVVARYRRGGVMAAEIYENGLRVQMHGEWWEAAWEGVERLRLTVEERSGAPLRAQISGGHRSVEVLGPWSPLERLLDEVIRHAKLVEDPVPAWAETYVGTEVRTWSRPAQRTVPKV